MTHGRGREKKDEALIEDGDGFSRQLKEVIAGKSAARDYRAGVKVGEGAARRYLDRATLRELIAVFNDFSLGTADLEARFAPFITRAQGVLGDVDRLAKTEGVKDGRAFRVGIGFGFLVTLIEDTPALCEILADAFSTGARFWEQDFGGKK